MTRHSFIQMSGNGDITVWINSPGGDCVAAAQIYNMLMDYKGNVTVKIDGIAASAASVIAMAGTKVLMSPVSMLMIHNPMTVAMGDTAEMQKAIEMLGSVKDSIINAYEIKTGLSRAKLSHLMDAETWMDATKAMELGFADEIMTRSDSSEDVEPPAVSMLYSKAKDTNGNEQVIDEDTATAIYESLIENGYVKKGQLTDKYYEDKANGEIEVAEEVADSAESVINIIDSIYDPRAMQPENARSNNVELQVDEDKLAMPEFKALWSRINAKSVYVVDFDTDELVNKAIAALDAKLHVPKIFFKVESGAMEQIKSKEDLLFGASFVREESAQYGTKVSASSNVKYDLIGKLVDETGLTRKAIVQILQGIKKPVFDQFKDNPEEFIIRAADIINDEKATAIIQHITYNALDEHYETDVFTEPTIKGKLGSNAMKAKKHLYDHIIYDSTNERDFAEQLDTNTDVAVYVKLPDGFYISTPVGRYNPDWAIAFYEGKVKHIYFVAETKGSMSSMQLRLVEESKIHCAREHFKAISSENVVYDVVDSYQSLLNKVMK